MCPCKEIVRVDRAREQKGAIVVANLNYHIYPETVTDDDACAGLA
jgi:hypothetical protein